MAWASSVASRPILAHTAAKCKVLSYTFVRGATPGLGRAPELSPGRGMSELAEHIPRWPPEFSTSTFAVLIACLFLLQKENACSLSQRVPMYSVVAPRMRAFLG